MKMLSFNLLKKCRFQFFSDSQIWEQSTGASPN